MSRDLLGPEALRLLICSRDGEYVAEAVEPVLGEISRKLIGRAVNVVEVGARVAPKD